MMTTGDVVIGNTGPYGIGTRRYWDGADDPLRKKSWNRYTLIKINQFSSAGNSGYPAGLGEHWVQLSDNDILTLLDKLQTKVKGHSFDAMVFAGTSHEVARSVVRTAQSVSHIYRALKRGDVGDAVRNLARSVSGEQKRDARRHLKQGDIGSAHLALAYGWVPFYEDCFEAVKGLEKLATEPLKTRVSQSRRRVAFFDGSQSPSLYSCPGTSVTVRKVTCELTEALSFARVSGLLDPVSLAWELIPFSFVVDWFLPIGKYVSQLSFYPFVKARYMVSEKSVSVCEFGQAYSPDFAGCVGKRTCVRYTRQPASTYFDIPPPSFVGYDKIFQSSQRIANAVALLSVLIGREHRPFKSRL